VHNLYAKCLEHRKECKIQSIWNPHLPGYVNHFLKIFAHHYRDESLFESIALGISGNWGESIYPATGCFIGGFHTHPGWWCGDKYAIESFRQFIAKKYASIENLNNCWNSTFESISEISFPSITHSRWKDLYYQIIASIPPGVKNLLINKKYILDKYIAPAIISVHNSFSKSKSQPALQEHKRLLDFVEWYQGSMTNWAEFWIKSARKYFPKDKIYLVTGGKGEPMLGADFSAQTKVARQYNAGIRITNQNNDYSESFIRTRLVSSACRNYGTYFTTEEAGINRPHGVTMRIFDVVTSGAKGAYFKSVIGTGTDVCTNRNLPPAEPTKGAENLLRNIHHLSLSKPIIDVAALFPNTSILIDHSIINSLYNKCSKLRSSIDLDLIDENMINDDLLKQYRFLIILDGKWLRKNTIEEMKNWVIDGGILITANYIIENNTELYRELFSEHHGVKRIHRGYTLLFGQKKSSYLSFISEAILNQDKKYPWKGTPNIVNPAYGQYATRFSDKIMYYDPINFKIRIRELSEKEIKPDPKIEFSAL